MEIKSLDLNFSNDFVLLRPVIDKKKIEVSWKKGKLVKRDENDICDLSFEKKDISLKYFK